jgi:hypothetical protein
MPPILVISNEVWYNKIVPTNPLWARVVGYGPFSLCVIHKEGLCPSSGDINRLIMMMTMKLCQPLLLSMTFGQTLLARSYV